VADSVTLGTVTAIGAQMACTSGLSIYEDLKLKKKEGESSGVVRKWCF
jgi:hypothetical protein